MCGFAGFVNFRTDMDQGELGDLADRMGRTIKHRGPDSKGIWTDAGKGVGLVFRRLAIIDLSEAGSQPMVSHCGRYIIVYNGEIYNFPELRSKLESGGVSFRGHSDTEVLLAHIACYGVRKTCDLSIGMFAFAVWDRELDVMTLARDRVGIKPLYWGQSDKAILFGSELKALRQHPAFDPEINRDAVASYLRFTYVPGPLSIYKSINKLEPGTIVTLKCDRDPQFETYWSLENTIIQAKNNPLDLSDFEATDKLESLLADAIGIRMHADVPLGAFLSGGLDSSTVVALMQAQSDKPVNTYTIAFDDPKYNEAAQAKTIAAHLGTSHTELKMTARDALDVIPQLSSMYDEPFSDSSQIPTHIVSRLTRQHVTISLSGDGGDELFAGYTRYLAKAQYDRILFAQPAWLRQMLAIAIRTLPPRYWNNLGEFIPEKRRPTLFGDKLYKLARMIDGPVSEYYQKAVSHWDNPDNMVVGGSEYQTAMHTGSSGIAFSNAIEEMQYLDTKMYMTDDILTKVDRASMAASLEARVPLLDHRIIEFAWRLPFEQKIRKGRGKFLLREVLYRHVPKALVDRPKAGFAVPIDSWLRGPLRDWAQELLTPDAMHRAGLANTAEITRKWDEHMSGQRNWQYHIWNILTLVAWSNENSA